MDCREGGLVLLAVVLYFVAGDTLATSAAVVLVFVAAWYFSGGRQWLYLFRKTACRDAK